MILLTFADDLEATIRPLKWEIERKKSVWTCFLCLRADKIARMKGR